MVDCTAASERRMAEIAAPKCPTDIWGFLSSASGLRIRTSIAAWIAAWIPAWPTESRAAVLPRSAYLMRLNRAQSALPMSSSNVASTHDRTDAVSPAADLCAFAGCRGTQPAWRARRPRSQERASGQYAGPPYAVRPEPTHRDQRASQRGRRRRRQTTQHQDQEHLPRLLTRAIRPFDPDHGRRARRAA